MSDDIAGRKADHLRIALEQTVEVPITSTPASAFAAVSLTYQALPEIDRDAIDTRVQFLGKTLSMPLLVGSMTGGTDFAHTINCRLAEAAQHTGIGMCLGSQRAMLERPALGRTFAVRDVAPDILLVGNIGAVQLNLGVTSTQIRGLVDAVGADAVVLHLNAAQEAIQPGGDTQFHGLTEKIATAATAVGVPVGVKEVGSGFSSEAVKKLAGLPLAFIESAGRGGTSWTLIEGKRAETAAGQALGALFADWGIPSVPSVLNCVRHGHGIPVVASGGLRHGLDAAKALALGATVTAMALPLLRAAEESTEAVVRAIEFFRAALVTTMFLTGCQTLADLPRIRYRLDPTADPDVYEGTRRRDDG